MSNRFVIGILGKTTPPRIYPVFGEWTYYRQEENKYWIRTQLVETLI